MNIADGIFFANFKSANRIYEKFVMHTGGGNSG